MKTWKSCLTKKELNHLKECGITTKASAIRTFKDHKKRRMESSIEPCFECKFIANKLCFDV